MMAILRNAMRRNDLASEFRGEYGEAKDISGRNLSNFSKVGLGEIAEIIVRSKHEIYGPVSCSSPIMPGSSLASPTWRTAESD